MCDAYVLTLQFQSRSRLHTRSWRFICIAWVTRML